MKRIIGILTFITSFLLVHTSCTEDFLQPKPLSFYAPENVYVNKAGFEAGLVTVRKDLKNDFYGNQNPLMLEYGASDYGVGGGMGDWRPITPSTGSNYLPILPLFERIYRYIKNTNVIISRIDDIKWADQNDRNNILGQALFYRSWWYYRLISSYGDVPFIGKELKGPKLDFFTHSKWTILEKIISDMESVVQWLPETTPVGVPNKYAALQFLAKLYLSNCEFDKAIEASTTIINGPYSLMKVRFGSSMGDKKRNLLWDLHRPENKSLAQNTEAIFILTDGYDAPLEARTAGTYTFRGYHNQWWYTWVIDSQGKPGFLTTNPDGSNTPIYDSLGRSNPDVRSCYWFNYGLFNESGYTWKNTPDLRRANINWVDIHEMLYNNPKSVDYGKPINFKYFPNSWDSLRLWPMPFYKTYFPHEKGFTGRPMGGNGNMYVFRLAEVYLLRAEAYFWKGQPALAATDINLIRARAKAPLITPADVSIDFIFDERMRELFLEEFRHGEMVRVANIMAKLNLNGYTIDNFAQKNWWYDRNMDRNTYFRLKKIGTSEYIASPYNVYWPIQIQIITTNTKGVINQNEGYDGSENNVPALKVIDESN